MNHNDIRHKLSDYIDNAVADAEKSAIEAHLKTCTDCAQAFAELQKTIDHMKQIEEIEPPAWMTGKIMATVRDDADQKKGFFRRLFYPLAINIPLQTVAVLFLAVTVYYLYQNINPAEKYAEAPQVAIARKDASARPDAAQQETVAPTPDQHLKKIEQEQSSRLLERQYDYEKAAQPAEKSEAMPAASAPAPAPAIQSPAETRTVGPLEKQPAARSAAPEAAQDKTRQPAESAAERKAMVSGAARPLPKTAIEKSSLTRLSIAAHDIASAAKHVEAIIREMNGSIVRSENAPQGKRILLSVAPDKFADFRRKLDTLGNVKVEMLASANTSTVMTVEILLSLRP